MKYRADIDGLRALAVLGVVLFHAGVAGLSGGFVGVDIFFVISGYLITGLLLNEARTTGSLNIGDFFARRIRRLMPALMLVLISTLLLGWVFLFPEDWARLGKSAKAVSLFSVNHYFMHYSGGYFDPSTDLMPLLHMWSLAVEEQYYLAWPLLFLLALRLTRRWEIGFSISAEGLLVFVLVLSFWGSCYWVRVDQPHAFYLMPLRAWEFAVGGLLHWAMPKLRSWNYHKLLALVFSTIGLALLLGSCVLLNEQMRFPAEGAIWPVVGSALFIMGGGIATNPISARFSNRILVGIGRISYSWYLWHWPLLAISRSYYLGQRLLVRDMLMVLLAFVLAILTYRYVEQPIRLRRPALFSSRRGSLLAGVLLSFSVLTLASGLVELGKKATPPKMSSDQVGLPYEQLPSCKEYDDGRLSPVSECVLGAAKTKLPELAIWGDSHAGHYQPMLAALAHAEAVSVVVRKHGGCPPLVGIVPFEKGHYLNSCRLFADAIMEEFLKKDFPQKGIILSARWGLHLARPPSDPGAFNATALLRLADRRSDPDSLAVGRAPLDLPGTLAALRSGLFATLDILYRRNVRVLIVADNPELPFDVPQCLRRRSAEECVVSRAWVDQRRAPILSIFNEAVTRYPNVRVWDAIDQFCDKEICHTTRNGKALYSDDDHISRYTAIFLQDSFKPQLYWLLGRPD